MTIHAHPVYIQIEPEATLWRYMSLDKFQRLLADKSLFFCRADKFADIYEGSIPRKEAEFRIKGAKQAAEFYGQKFNEETEWKNIKDRGAFHKTFKSATIVNCWHISKHESDGMWRLYLDDNDGIAIQSSGERVIQAMEACAEPIEMSKVRYIDYENDIWYHPEDFPHKSYNMITPLIHKRREFAHEQEFRLFKVIDEATGSAEYWQADQKGSNVTVNLELLIERVVLHPMASKLAFERAEQMLKDAGLNVPVVYSNLSTEPYY